MVIDSTLNRNQMYAHQLVSAVEYLHNKKQIIHMDIKPENVLVTSQDQVKLTDFGCAVEMKGPRQVFHGDYGGTHLYKPPELLDKDGCFDSTVSIAWYL